MALARVVTFDGVSSDRMAEMQRELDGGERPDDIPAKEMIVLHDPDSEKSLVVVFFENEDDYRRRRRGAQRDAGSRHAGPADVGCEIPGRLPDGGLATARRARAWGRGGTPGGMPGEGGLWVVGGRVWRG